MISIIDALAGSSKITEKLIALPQQNLINYLSRRNQHCSHTSPNYNYYQILSVPNGGYHSLGSYYFGDGINFVAIFPGLPNQLYYVRYYYHYIHPTVIFLN